MSEIEGVLLDIDGVLAVSWEPIPGAIDALEWLRAEAIPFRLVTNTTTHTRRDLAQTLVDAGIKVEAEEIITAVAATASYLQDRHRGATVFLLSDEEAVEDLAGVDLIDGAAQVVVVGGACDRFSYENVNKAFRMLMEGAAFVAMHRSMYWKTSEGLQLDGGAYIVGLEEATGVKAVVCGKPAPAFFQSGLAALGLPAEGVAMVGDDVVTDVLAAQDVGLVGVLARTGKFQPSDLERDLKPDHVIASVAELPQLLRPS